MEKYKIINLKEYLEHCDVCNKHSKGVVCQLSHEQLSYLVQLCNYDLAMIALTNHTESAEERPSPGRLTQYDEDFIAGI